jgi:prevent-host-death family protein
MGSDLESVLSHEAPGGYTQLAMHSVNICEAKAHLSRLLKRVERGEEITITRRRTPVARLVPVRASPRRPGRLKGRIHVAEDFDAPLPAELLDKFRA